MELVMPRDDLLFSEIDLASTLEAQQRKLKETIESFDAKSCSTAQ